MGFEVWIAIVLVASGLSGWIGFALARKDAPKQSDLDTMAAELDEARRQAESVQANVGEHFEQSAMLFGKLAADYREFLDHFEASAQNLGLSEARARELIEQGFQPLLTHQDTEDAVVAEAEATDLPADAEAAVAAEAPDSETSEAGASASSTEESTSSAEQTGVSAEEPNVADEKTADVAEVTVELPDTARDPADETEPKTAVSGLDDPASADRQRA